MDLKEFIDTYTKQHGPGIVRAMCDYIGKSRQFVYSVKTKRFNPSMAMAHKISEFTHGLVQVHEIRKCTYNCAPNCACSKGKSIEVVKIEGEKKNPR